jgi:uncharacterized protein YjbI with pentapeptide repeats
MADKEHLAILKQGVEVWNRWREENPDIWGVDLRGAYLRMANLSGANLSDANLSEADLNRANLSDANLNEANLSEADLSGADLSWASLRGANLRGANLHHADLFCADLRRADLSEVNLGEANLSEANLGEANLSLANLRGANLHHTDLSWAYFSEANLSEANFSYAIALGTGFGNLDLSVVKGLETIHHRGPSTVGIDTIYRSRGKIPEAFLRGCGVPNTLIAYVASLTGEAIQYYSCFISYSSKDEDFAQRLHADLQQEGVRCWFAPEDMKIGDEIRPRIQESIKGHDKLLVVLSEHSINSSWVEDEVETAFEEESRRKKTVLFPIRLDDTAMEAEQAWAAKIRRTRHIGDFSRWKDHDSYHQAFNRLLRDLKASEA